MRITVHPYKDASAVFPRAVQRWCKSMEISSKESKKFCNMSKFPRSIQETDFVIYWALSMVRPL